MKYLFLLVSVVMTATLALGADAAPQAAYFPQSKVEAALAKGGTLASASDYIVLALHRAEPGAAELHETQTDIYYVTKGEATFVTGGELLGNKVVSPGQRQGTGIEGGEVHHLTKGDVVVIPAGVPHWFKAVQHPVSYLLIKVVKP